MQFQQVAPAQPKPAMGLQHGLKRAESAMAVAHGSVRGMFHLHIQPRTQRRKAIPLPATKPSRHAERVKHDWIIQVVAKRPPAGGEFAAQECRVKTRIVPHNNRAAHRFADIGHYLDELWSIHEHQGRDTRQTSDAIAKRAAGVDQALKGVRDAPAGDTKNRDFNHPVTEPRRKPGGFNIDKCQRNVFEWRGNRNLREMHSLIIDPAGSELHPDDATFKDERAVDDALRLTTDAPVAFPLLLAQHVQALAGDDLLSKFALRDTAEANEALPLLELLCVERSHLGGQLDHQHARKQGPAWNVPGHPEFVVPDIAETNQLMFRFIHMHHALKHLERVTVWVDFPDHLGAVNHAGEVDPFEVHNELRRHDFALFAALFYETTPTRARKPPSGRLWNTETGL